MLWIALISCEGSPRCRYVFSSYGADARYELEKSYEYDVKTDPVKIECDPCRSRFSTHSRMEHPRDHGQIDQYPVLFREKSRGMNAVLSRRNTDNNLILCNAVLLEALHQRA